MSTQHPDNARVPPFADEPVVKGEGEITEALHVFSALGCDEQLWDYEGKAADVDVVLKLLLKAPDFFSSHVLGQDVFLTLRIPNPTVEQEMRKKVEEALPEELVRIDAYYREVVVGMEQHVLPGGLRVHEWLGDYRPESIQVIPLVEDMPRMVQVDQLTQRYLDLLGRPVEGLRVFLARSATLRSITAWSARPCLQNWRCSGCTNWNSG